MGAEPSKVQKPVESDQKHNQEENGKIAFCCSEADVKYSTDWTIEIGIYEPHKGYIRPYAEYNDSEEKHFGPMLDLHAKFDGNDHYNS